ncbi:cytochrome b [Croceicoccus sp. F390]|uniref:Cytochrome b n=1 Tax=Croceicoccus esteveae TaxID=3075597 RepID=A0ABU2ZGV9_9SPHN|nr:cytochrome b [Croceicoccus sp. F390]MDT0575611.1 cytochrome b [Croceicoccus sp. F390]
MTSVPSATDQQAVTLRYNNGAVALHWLIAVLILTQLYIGFVFAGMERGPQSMQWFSWHKTFGVLILVLSMVRLGWRLAHPPPPFPDTMPRWERLAAVWNHRLFYFLLFALPLTGLATISAGGGGTTELLAGIPFPLIPGIPDAAGDTLGETHEVLVFVFIALLVLHVAAAIKLQFVDRSRAAGRMPPLRAPSDAKV